MAHPRDAGTHVEYLPLICRGARRMVLSVRVVMKLHEGRMLCRTARTFCRITSILCLFRLFVVFVAYVIACVLSPHRSVLRPAPPLVPYS